jgi:hypothetical protein
MASETLASSDDSGGIHVVPGIGDATALETLYRQQWHEVFLGYLVDAVEPVLLIALALTALCAGAARGSVHRAAWLAGALLAMAILRGNLALFAWFHLESATLAEAIGVAILPPLCWGLWATALERWFALPARRSLWTAIAALSAGLVISHTLTWDPLAGLPDAILPSIMHAIEFTCDGLAVMLYTGTILLSWQRRSRAGRWDLGAFVIVAVVLFVDQLDALRVASRMVSARNRSLAHAVCDRHRDHLVLLHPTSMLGDQEGASSTALLTRAGQASCAADKSIHWLSEGRSTSRLRWSSRPYCDKTWRHRFLNMLV